MERQIFLSVDYNEHTCAYAPESEADEEIIHGSVYYCALATGVAQWEFPEQGQVWKIETTNSETRAVNQGTKEKCLATVWEVYVDDSDNRYFYNNLTKESTWTPPLWIDLIDTSSNTFLYFYCHETGEAAWLPPQELIEDFSQYASSSLQELPLSLRFIKEYCTLQADKKRERTPDQQEYPETPGKLAKLYRDPPVPPGATPHVPEVNPL